jgi:hypothetical protein
LKIVPEGTIKENDYLMQSLSVAAASQESYFSKDGTMPLGQLEPLNVFEADWAAGRDNEMLDVFHPAMLNVLAKFPGAEEQDVEDAIGVAAGAFQMTSYTASESKFNYPRCCIRRMRVRSHSAERIVTQV